MRGIAIVLVALAGSGCHESCLDGAANCRISSPCEGLHYQCGGGLLELRVLEGRARLDGLETGGGRGDILLGNDRMVAVVAALGNSNYLDAAGGALLDLGPRGGSDGISEILQAV